MIVIHCPHCESTHVTRYKGKMTEKGHDWMTCKACEKNFPLKKASYSEETDLYD